VADTVSTLKKSSTSFAKAQLWKHCNKLKEYSTVNMDEEELQIHREALRLIQKDLKFTQANEAVVEDDDDEKNIFIYVVILIYMGCKFNYYVMYF
jgi:hypothetical protein